MLQDSNFHDVQEVKHVTKEKECGLLFPKSRNLNADSTQASRECEGGTFTKAAAEIQMPARVYSERTFISSFERLPGLIKWGKWNPRSPLLRTK